MNGHPFSLCRCFNFFSQACVGGHPPHNGHVPTIHLFSGGKKLEGENIHHRGLETSRNVRDFLVQMLHVFFDIPTHAGLQATEAEIEFVFVEVGSLEEYFFGIPFPGHVTDNLSSRVAEIEHFGDLVKCFAGCVIPCLTH